ncbi:pilus assembly protein TadG-related protein [Pararhodobacter sp. SW119]|uniref:pilus assembly protein TadG-related protein n=1 Tax=Pararhodobacter sp. SW119 TaxID=2780075 RepID=UPI001ADF94F7|nr:pilus assembly protein TadG-related protein [Pararhodobacter sp. SW119]
MTESSIFRPRDFFSNEDGFFTVFSLYVLIVMILLSGFALDLANHYSARTQLQTAADSAAHAALVVRQREEAVDAVDFALAVHVANMSPERFGAVLTDEDIEFGTWSFQAREFVPDPDSLTAARATTRLANSRANQLRTFLLRFAGVDSFDVQATAVFARYQPACLREGFVAEGKVDMQSNNNFFNGFCIHSNDHVRFNQNNYFEEGTIVSMPDLDKLDIPNSGFSQNEGLEAALREGKMDIRILDELENIIEGLGDREAAYLPDYVNPLDPVITIAPNNNLEAGDFTPGRVHRINCSNSNGKFGFKNNVVLTEVVIVTNCQVSMSQNMRLEDVILATTNTNTKSISGASSANFGRDDDCAPGGGAQIITLGGMEFPSSLGIFGSQLLAQGNIEFAARADGIQGASLVAGGQIDGTSNSSMSLCGSGMEGNFEANYFRMVF